MWPLANDVVVDRQTNTPWVILNVEMRPESHGGIVMRMANVHDKSIVKNLKFLRMGSSPLPSHGRPSETRMTGAAFQGHWHKDPIQEEPEGAISTTFIIAALAEEGEATALLRVPPAPARVSLEEMPTAWEIIDAEDD